MINSFFANKKLITELHSVLNTYMSKKEIKIIEKAYKLSEEAHSGQYRKSGEAYIDHPLSVALILANLHLDYYCITAAILHDCIEDTHISKDDIVLQFGNKIAHIVEGVTNLTNLKFNSKYQKQSQNLQKLFFAMSKDMRVIIIKLADRLHNMRTISSMSKQKQIEKAIETEEIYAPIAYRLGLNNIKTELENICFKILHPRTSIVLKNTIDKEYGNYKKNINLVKTQIKKALLAENIFAEIDGRQKSLYSIYNKMKNKSLKFSEILDLYAFRVIVENAKDCYHVLGILHSLYQPITQGFQDYIAIPKINGYQAIHTILIGPKKTFIELQIKSKEMHFASEYGIAAHWHYKSTKENSETLANNWLGSLIDLQNSSDSSMDFLTKAKEDLFSQEVLVFTPFGEIIQLPAKSTAIDFAYAVHTSIGKKAKKAKINGRLAPLTSELKTGQTVEIITGYFSNPEHSWLNFAVTPRAQISIKSQLKEKSKNSIIKIGKKLVLDAFELQEINVNDISREKWQEVIKALNCKNVKELYMKVGLYEILVSVVINMFSDNKDKSKNVIKIGKTKGMAIIFAHCCYPIPGDDVVGITTGKGIAIHRKKCSNLAALKSKRSQWIDILWDPRKNELFQVYIRITAKNKSGVLALVTNVLAQMKVNIEYINQHNKDELNKFIDLIIDVSNKKQLDQMIVEISSLDNIVSITRS